MDRRWIEEEQKRLPLLRTETGFTGVLFGVYTILLLARLCKDILNPAMAEVLSAQVINSALPV